ncbi:LPXTG cell wall anchor domain-containing protein [Luedemannella flava]
MQLAQTGSRATGILVAAIALLSVGAVLVVLGWRRRPAVRLGR